MPVNYPGSLDSAIHPGPGTYRDDPGFQLSLMVSNLWDAVVALENKLGISASTPGASAAVLRRTASGASAWGALQAADMPAGTINKVALDFNLASDVNGVALAATTWTVVGGTQTYTIADASSLVEVHVGGGVNIQSANGAIIASRVLIQSATPYLPLGGGIVVVATTTVNALAGASMVPIANLGPGTYQIAIQVYSTAAGQIFCRPGTIAGEGLRIHVRERLR